jgi:hypothetical protein
MSIRTGEFFTCILMAISPTALGQAIEHEPKTAADWSAALSKDIDNGNSVEDPGVVIQLQALLAKNPAIFNALLTPVLVPDARSGFSPVPVAKVLKDQIWMLGSSDNFLTVPWDTPPHPGSQDITALVNNLLPYDETK